MAEDEDRYSRLTVTFVIVNREFVTYLFTHTHTLSLSLARVLFLSVDKTKSRLSVFVLRASRLAKTKS